MNNNGSNRTNEKDNTTLLLWVAVLAIVLLIVIYSFIGYVRNTRNDNFDTASLITDVLAGAIGSLISYIVLLIFLKSRGISLSGDQIAVGKVSQIVRTVSLEQAIPKGKIIQLLIQKMQSLRVDDLKLYTFHGLRPNTRSSNTIQNFEINREQNGQNINAVHYLWADTYKGSKINASIKSEGGFFLRVDFENYEFSYPCNIAIRPQCEEAIEVRQEKLFVFEARIPEEASQNNSLLKEVAIGVRVVNGWLQHWEYTARPGEYKLQNVSNHQWQKFSIDLNTNDVWHLFRPPGNYQYGPEDYPDFTIISSIIFEFGCFQVGRPGQGKGIIDIKDLKLTDVSR